MPLWTTRTRSGVDLRVGGEHVVAAFPPLTAMIASAASIAVRSIQEESA